MNENNILAAVLAGGKSSRFGTDKSLVKLGGKSLLDHTINKIKECKTGSQLGHQDVPIEDVVINSAASVEEN